MARLWHDVVNAARMLARTPAVTAAALLTLALGTGVNTAVYSIVDAVLLRSLPFPDADALLQVWRTELPRLQYGSASYPRYLDWRARNRVFAELGAYAPTPRTLTGRDAVAERLATGRATASFFTALGAAPLAGRFPNARDDQPGGEPVVVLGEQWWRSRFGADPTILDQSLTLDGVAHTVIGIAPAGYAEMWRVDAWTPLALAADPAARNDN